MPSPSPAMPGTRRCSRSSSRRAARAGSPLVDGVLRKVGAEPALPAQRGHRRDRRPADDQGRSAGAPHGTGSPQRAASGRQVRSRARRPVRLHRAPAPRTREPQRQGCRHPEERRSQWDNLRHAISEVRRGKAVTDQSPEEGMEALKRFGVDLTERAEKGELDPVIGRDEEIRRVIQCLSRRTKNNRCSSASPASARRRSPRASRSASCSGDVPESLKDRRVVSVDIGGMLARREVHAASSRSDSRACSPR